MIRLILGLGNPGKEYENTRHNAGRMAAEYFAKSREFSAKGGPAFGWEHDKKSNALISKNSRVIVALPETFMNKSGSAAVKLIKLKKELKDLVVIHDDIDLPLGRFKISYGKSSGFSQRSGVRNAGSENKKFCENPNRRFAETKA